MDKMNGLYIPSSWLLALEQLNNAERGELLYTALKYGESLEVSEFSPEFSNGRLDVIWGFVKPEIDRQKVRHCRIVTKRKRAAEMQKANKPC